jgi:hypothetical protein
MLLVSGNGAIRRNRGTRVDRTTPIRMTTARDGVRALRALTGVVQPNDERRIARGRLPSSAESRNEGSAYAGGDALGAIKRMSREAFGSGSVGPALGLGDASAARTNARDDATTAVSRDEEPTRAQCS